jgi:outer membrane protein TolC
MGTHLISVGNLIAGSRTAASPTTLLATLVSLDPIYLDFDMSESDFMTYSKYRKHLFNGKAFQAIGAGALRWRLFDFGKVAAEVAQSRGAYAEALVEYRQAALRAMEDIENALIELAQTQVRLQDLQGEVTSLTRARDLSERAYKAGAIPLTDVLDADRQLLVARDDVESTRADTVRAAVRTFRHLGAGGTPVHRCGEVRG